MSKGEREMIVSFFLTDKQNAPVIEVPVNYLRYRPLDGMVVLNSVIKIPVRNLIDVRQNKNVVTRRDKNEY